MRTTFQVVPLSKLAACTTSDQTRGKSRVEYDSIAECYQFALRYEFGKSIPFKTLYQHQYMEQIPDILDGLALHQLVVVMD